MSRKIDLMGLRFGKLKVLRDAGKTKSGQYKWLCECDCGNSTVVHMSNLRGKHTTSCGCVVSPDLKNRFDGKIGVSHNNCWLWTGQLNRCGVALFWLRGKTVKAKYAAWELYRGTLPDNCYLTPTCGNNHCVNPDHLKIMSKVPEKRFWAYVREANTECWEWVGCKNPKGYGKYPYNGETLAHRVSWVMHNGEIPAGLFVCHQCDNPSCVNPGHLFLGTNQDNVNDMVSKGRQKRYLTKDQVRSILTQYQNGTPQRKLAREYNVGRSQIKNVVRGVTYMEVQNENQ